MKHKKNYLIPYLLILPAFLLVLLVVVYPITSSIIRSFRSNDGSFTLTNYSYFFTNSLELNNIAFTLVIAILTAILSIIFAYALALYLRFTQSKISKAIGMLYMIPRFIPGLVIVYAIILIIQDSGVIFRISHLFGEGIKPNLMFNAKGLVFANLWFNIPFSTMIISSSLSSIPNSIIESARDVGASRLTVFFKMILPLSYKDVFVSITFVFMGVISSFTTPYLMMGAKSPKMLGLSLFDQFNKYLDYGRTSALSTIMFLICSISAFVYIYTNLNDNKWER